MSYLCDHNQPKTTFNNWENMKKTLTFSGIAAMLCIVLFTSCSKDEKIAIRVSGEWEGDWGMSYADKEGNHYDSHNTAIKFFPNEKFDTEGYGYQEDYYDEGPFKKLGYYFTWYVDKKVLYINYPGYPEYNARIYDYRLKKKHFTGRFGNSSTTFDLIKIEKYYKWYDYLNQYAKAGAAILLWTTLEAFIDYYDYYPSVRSTEPNPPTDTMNDVLPIRIYNRYVEQP